MLSTCTCCRHAVAQAETCYVCLCAVCLSCAQQDGAGDSLCPDCSASMHAFLADEDPEEVA